MIDLPDGAKYHIGMGLPARGLRRPSGAGSPTAGAQGRHRARERRRPRDLGSRRRRTTTVDELHHDGDYSPWEGWHVLVWPVTTILRGRVVVEDGRLSAEAGYGRFVPRTIDPCVLERPHF